MKYGLETAAALCLVIAAAISFEKTVNAPPEQKLTAKVQPQIEREPNSEQESPVNPWLHTYREAARSGKLILIYYTNPGCRPCVPFWERCLTHESVQGRLAEFALVKVADIPEPSSLERQIIEAQGKGLSSPYVVLRNHETNQQYGWQPVVYQDGKLRSDLRERFAETLDEAVRSVTEEGGDPESNPQTQKEKR